MITSDDILGKVAVDVEGGILGVIVKLHIDKKSKTIIGITVDQGLWKPDLYVGSEFIKQFGVDSVFLNQLPVTTHKKCEVLTNSGALVGIVKEVNEKNNVLDSIVVSGKGGYKGQKLTISKKHIEELGKRIVLKKNWKK